MKNVHNGKWKTMVAAVAAAAFAGMSTGHAQSETIADLAAAAAEKGVVTWCNGSIPDVAMQAVIDSFQAAYPGVRLEGIRSTSQIAYQRLSQDLQMGMANCDLFSSSDYSQFIQLKEDGHLFEYQPIREAEIPEAFGDLYDSGFFYPGMVGTMIMAYNPEAVAEEAVPKTWKDILDPSWKDRIAVGHPGYSGYVGTWVVMISDLYGWEFFEQLNALNPMIGRSATDAITQLVAGERDLAIAPGQTAFRAIGDGAAIELIYPEDGVLLMSSPVAIVATTENPSGAKLALEYMLSEEYSRTMQRFGYEPINRNVEPAPNAVPLDEITVRRPSVEDIEAKTNESIENWRDIFGG